MKKLTILTVLAAILSSCTPSIKDLNLYKKQFLTKSQYMPSKEQIRGKAPKIVVFTLEQNGEVAENAKLGSSIATNLENVISKNKLGKLVDRRSAKKLKNEIALSEMNKSGSYKGPQIADFAITGNISSAGFTKKYNSASNYYNPKTGAYVRNPANFKYSTQTNGNVKILELPSLDVIDSIEFDGYASRTENVQSQGGFALGSLSIGGTQATGANRDDNLVRKAGGDAIKNIEPELRGALSARGYILEKRVGEDFTIFKVTLGEKHGVKHGDKLKIISKFDVTNEIIQDSDIETRVVGEGIISNIVENNYSWIIVKEDKGAGKVRLGDQVKMNFERGSFAKMIKDTRKYTN